MTTIRRLVRRGLGLVGQRKGGVGGRGGHGVVCISSGTGLVWGRVLLSGEGCGVADGIGVTGTAFVSCGRSVVAPCGVVTSSAGVVGSLRGEMGCDGHERFGG